VLPWIVRERAYVRGSKFAMVNVLNVHRLEWEKKKKRQKNTNIYNLFLCTFCAGLKASLRVNWHGSSINSADIRTGQTVKV